MLGARRTVKQKDKQYAIGSDFCRIFMKDMNGLHLLSFSLTADHGMAEKCFVQGLEDAANSGRVFKEWANSWARRMIIQNAIQMVHPRLTDDAAAGPRDSMAPHIPAEMAGVVDLPAFERFAFVMSVLERFSDSECSLLLDCNRDDVVAARTRALQQLASSANLRIQTTEQLGRSAGLQTGPEIDATLAASA